MKNAKFVLLMAIVIAPALMHGSQRPNHLDEGSQKVGDLVRTASGQFIGIDSQTGSQILFSGRSSLVVVSAASATVSEDVSTSAAAPKKSMLQAICPTRRQLVGGVAVVTGVAGLVVASGYVSKLDSRVTGALLTTSAITGIAAYRMPAAPVQK